MTAPVIVCACGRAYDEAGWRGLHKVGIQEDVFGAPPSELRNCTCGSTISRVMPAVDVRKIGWLRGLLGGRR